MVHECDPTTLNAGVSRPALGVFAHEAVCVDPVGERLYLTEDEGDGCLYRFTPDRLPRPLGGAARGARSARWTPTATPCPAR